MIFCKRVNDLKKRGDGINAIEKMWNLLDGCIQYEKMGYAFHHLDTIIELLKRDQSIEIDEK